jgi:peptidoglycan/LPS O-acetylase OafA/YrhL
MWTIAYEFRCYLVVLVLGKLGLLERRPVMALFVAASIGTIFVPEDGPFHLSWLAFGAPALTLRTMTFYLAGALFYLYRDRIVYDVRFAALVAATACLVAWLNPVLATPVTAVFGGYVLFWAALGLKSAPLSRIGRNVDLSFGLYLFAWPVQNALAWNFPGLTPLPLFAAVLSITTVLALLCWLYVEKPAMALARRPRPAVFEAEAEAKAVAG